METSTAVLLPPDEVDDKAPPTDCRTSERTSQGYIKFRVSIACLGMCLEIKKASPCPCFLARDSSLRRSKGTMEVRTIKIQK